MIKAFAASMIALLPCAAMAQGVFANASGCARLGGETGGDDVVIWDGASFEFWESRCPVIGSTPVGGGAVVVTLECLGEGETWQTYYMIETTSDADRFVVYPEEFPDLRTELTTCN